MFKKKKHIYVRRGAHQTTQIRIFFTNRIDRKTVKRKTKRERIKKSKDWDFTPTVLKL